MPKNVLITGVTGNLGAVVAKSFMNSGYQVIGTIRPETQKPDIGIDFFECDLSDETSTDTAFQSMKKKYATLHAAILLAGGFGMGNIEDISEKEMMHMFSLNYLTAFHSAKNAFNWMKMTGGGRIIFTGAKPALEGGGADMLPYTISKSAVIKLAEILDEDGAKHHIRTSTLVPGIIDTPPNRKAMPDADYSSWTTPEAIAQSLLFHTSGPASQIRNATLKIYNNT